MKSLKITVSELILSAVYFLQKKNGVSAKDITKYICQKRGLTQSLMKKKVKEALERGTQNGIFNLKRGLYKVQKDYEKKLPHLKGKVGRRARLKTSKGKFIRKKNSKDLPRLQDRKQEIMNFKLKALPVSLKKQQKCRMLESLAKLDDEFEQREGSYFDPSMFIKRKDKDDISNIMAKDCNCSDLTVGMDKVRLCTGRTSKSGNKPYYTLACCCPRKRVRRCQKRKHRGGSSTSGKSKRAKSKSCRRSKKSESSRKSRSSSQKKIEQKNPSSSRQSHIAKDFQTASDSDEGKSENNRPVQVVGSKWKARREAREQKSENEEKKETNTGRKDNGGNKENQTKQKPDGEGKKSEDRKSSSSSDSGSDEETRSGSQDTSKKTEKPVKKEVELNSSSELLPSDFKLSLTSSLDVSDVKISPSSLKFDDQESTTVLYSEKQKKQQESQQKQNRKQETLNDVKSYCDCKSNRRKNRGLSCRDNRSPTKEGESTQGRLKSKCSRK